MLLREMMIESSVCLLEKRTLAMFVVLSIATGAVVEARMALNGKALFEA
jgi:hypothetical protein